MSEYEAMSRAQRAAEELQEVQAAFDHIRSDIFEQLAITEDDESAKREALFLEVRALDRVRSRLSSVISSGKLAKHLSTLRARGFKE